MIVLDLDPWVGIYRTISPNPIYMHLDYSNFS